MVLFEDGFESNDFSAWNGTAGTPTVESAYSHHGDYSFYTDGSASPEYCFKSGFSNNTLYMRAYFYFDQLINDNGEYTSLFMYYGGALHRLQLYITGGTLSIGHYNGSSYIATTSVSLTPDTWYCIEWRVVRDATAGESQCWINSVSQFNAGSLNTGSSAISIFYLGGAHSGDHVDWYADCIVVDGSRINCEGAAGLSIPVAMHHYNRINHIIRG